MDRNWVVGKRKSSKLYIWNWNTAVAKTEIGRDYKWVAVWDGGISGVQF